ncbi:unnamed protein product [Periconia digitata]|uniref:Uncharacterized protein n=1 Tax=Periconia digitata TaxID=1303443 RepID=A0A9W4XLY7_9PLEO|nr:unnamed protein product [Periconia digitata]
MSFLFLFTYSMLISTLLIAAPAAGLCTTIKTTNNKNPQLTSDLSPDQGHPHPQQAPAPNPNLGLLLHPISYSAGPAVAQAPPATNPKAASGAEVEAAAQAQAAAPVQQASAAPAKAASAATVPGNPRSQQSRLQLLQAPSNSCTFRAYGIQMCDPVSASSVTYLQINQILNADGSLAVDVRRGRPRAAFNSYEKLVPGRAWHAASLTHGDTLEIKLDSADGKIGFNYGGARWTNEDGVDTGKAGWCEVEGWNDEEEWDCGNGAKGTRSSNMICGFPCGVQESMEL